MAGAWRHWFPEHFPPRSAVPVARCSSLPAQRPLCGRVSPAIVAAPQRSGRQDNREVTIQPAITLYQDQFPDFHQNLRVLIKSIGTCDMQLL